MPEGTPQQPTPSGADNTDAEEAVAGQGGEGRQNAEATPPIADDAVHGQTAVPASEEDAGEGS